MFWLWVFNSLNWVFLFVKQIKEKGLNSESIPKWVCFILLLVRLPICFCFGFCVFFFFFSENTKLCTSVFWFNWTEITVWDCLIVCLILEFNLSLLSYVYELVFVSKVHGSYVYAQIWVLLRFLDLGSWLLLRSDFYLVIGYTSFI